jgi:hypothetical protein
MQTAAAWQDLYTGMTTVCARYHCLHAGADAARLVCPHTSNCIDVGRCNVVLWLYRNGKGVPMPQCVES